MDVSGGLFEILSEVILQVVAVFHVLVVELFDGVSEDVSFLADSDLIGGGVDVVNAVVLDASSLWGSCVWVWVLDWSGADLSFGGCVVFDLVIWVGVWLLEILRFVKALSGNFLGLGRVSKMF